MWTNPKLTVKTTVVLYNTCVVSTLMYAGETRTTYARQENRLNSIHLRNIRHVLARLIVEHRELTLIRQCRLCWLGHVYRMKDGQVQKHILYGELASRRRTKDRPQLRYKDVCKGDMKALDINRVMGA